MTILGIDPGTTSIGYAFIKSKEVKPLLLEAGLLKFPKGNLVALHSEFNYLIKKWKAEIVSIERVFFAKNTKTAISVAQARGAILLTTGLAGLKLYEYTPLEVKKALTGDGRADKTQIKKMLKLTLPEAKYIKGGDDVFDATALALTCFFDGKRRFN